LLIKDKKLSYRLQTAQRICAKRNGEANT